MKRHLAAIHLQGEEAVMHNALAICAQPWNLWFQLHFPGLFRLRNRQECLYHFQFIRHEERSEPKIGPHRFPRHGSEQHRQLGIQPGGVG